MHKISDGTRYVDRDESVNVELEIGHLLAHRLRSAVSREAARLFLPGLPQNRSDISLV